MPSDEERTKAELIRELRELRRKVAALEPQRQAAVTDETAGATDLRRTEEELRRSRSAIDSIFRAAPTGIGVVRQRILVEINDRVCEMTGYTREELVGKNARILYPTEEDFKYVGREKYRQIREAGTGTVETRWKRKDGQVIDVLLSSTPVDAADLSAEVTFTALDITERRRAAEELRRSEERLRAIFDAAANVSLILTDAADPEPTVIDFSTGAEMIFGYRRSEMVGRPVSTLYLPGDVARFPRIHERMRRGEAGFRGETTLVRKSGKRFPALSESYPLLDERGEMYAALLVSVDISDRMRAEEERLRLETRLRQVQKMEAVGQLAGGVAHDFNNVLQAIQGYTDLALALLPEEHPVREKLHEVLKATDRAAALTRQMLTFSRRETLQPKKLNLNEVVNGLTKMLGRVIGEHIQLHVWPGHNLKTVLADPGQIEQLLMSLCLNARDAMPDGGELIVKTENLRVGPDDELRAGIEQGDYVQLTVSDTGQGIPTELQDRVFEPFFTTKEIGEGSGLGLATAYAIAERHGGAIELSSVPGAGTKVRVLLPASGLTAVATEEAEQSVALRGGTETILLAEDDELVRNLAAVILRSAGYRLLLAGDGEEALDLLDDHAAEIDLAILDVVMPKQSGRAVYDRIQARNSAIRVLFSSGYSYSELEGRLPEAGAELIRKPYTPGELLHKVRSLIDAR